MASRGRDRGEHGVVVEDGDVGHGGKTKERSLRDTTGAELPLQSER